MGQRLTPIHSLRDDDPEVGDAIDEFVVGLGEWIDGLQDAHAAGDLAAVADLAAAQAERAEDLGYPSLGDASRDVMRSAGAGEDDASRKAISGLIEIVQRVRLGHRSAA
jgi:hypothetical protein